MIVYVTKDFLLMLSRKHSIKISCNVQTHYLHFFGLNRMQLAVASKIKTNTSQMQACPHRSNGIVHNMVNLRIFLSVKYH